MLFTYDKINKWVIIPSTFGTEVTIQQLVDDIRDFEDGWNGLDEEQVAIASGKEALGGGSQVGITLKLNKWKVKFQDRPGLPWVNCTVYGGNLAAVDVGGNFVWPLAPSNYVTASFSQSSSATFTQSELTELQHGTFEGAVWIDAVNGHDGTTYPLGTPADPVKRLADAKSIAALRGLTKLHFVRDYTFGVTDNIDGFSVEGEDEFWTTLTFIPAGCSTSQTIFQRCKLVGTLNGYVEIKECEVGDLSGFQGDMHEPILSGTITLTGSGFAYLFNPSSASVGIGEAIINMGGSGRGLRVRNASGAYKIINKIGSDAVFMDFSSGRVVIDSTCSGGTITIRGIAKVEDSHSLGCTVDIETVLSPLNIADYVLDEQVSQHTASGSLGKGVSDIKGKTDQLTFTIPGKVDATAELTDEEHDAIMLIPVLGDGIAVLAQDIADLTDLVVLLKAFIKNRKYVMKLGPTWYLIIRNNTNTEDILKKALKDKSGNDITDLQAGMLAIEDQSNV